MSGANSVAFLGLLKMQLNINRKTSCNAFPNRLVSILHLLIQEQRQFCYSFLILFEWLLKGI